MTKLSRIRLDPLPGVYQLRVYPHPVQTDKPIEHEMAEYQLVANVVIAGNVATATLMQGEIPTDAWAEFDQQLASMGVGLLIWERHKNGGIKKIQRSIK